MRDLIMRLEAATEGSRELDCVGIYIAVAVSLENILYWALCDKRGPSRSLDTALTLPDANEWLSEAVNMARFRGYASDKFASGVALELCRLVIAAKAEAKP